MNNLQLKIILSAADKLLTPLKRNLQGSKQLAAGLQQAKKYAQVLYSQALLIAALIAGVSLLAAWLGDLFGSAGVLVTTMLVALAEVHAAAAGVAQLQVSGVVPLEVARWGVLGVLSSSCLAKTVLAFASGGLRYGWQVATGLFADRKSVV